MVSSPCAAWASPTRVPNKSPLSSLRSDAPQAEWSAAPCGEPEGPGWALSGIAPSPAPFPSLWVGMVESSRHGSGSLRR